MIMENTRKYFSPISDVGFKRLFASEQNEDLRLQLLNAIITDGSPVISAELLNSEHAIRADTTARFDLYCRREDGSRIIVEMQHSVHGNFPNRALAYSSLAFIDQWSKGWEYKIDRVYFIGILRENLFPGRPGKPITTVKLMSVDEPHIVVSDKYLQIYVELPKLAGKAPKAMSDGELFLSAMNGLYEWDERPEEYQDKVLDRLFAESAYGFLTDEERAKHDSEMTTERDYAESLKYWAGESYKEGRAKGREEGREESRLEVARNLKSAGVDLETIARCAGLSQEVVNGL